MEGAPVWSLNGLRFDPEARDVNGVHWFVTDESGFWGAPGTSAELNQRLNQHGARRTPGWKTERTISLTGNAFAPTYAALRTASASVTGLLSDPDAPSMLTCHSEIGDLTCDVFLDGEVLTTPTDTFTPGFEWSIQLVAPDPRRYLVDWQTLRATLPQTGQDGLDFRPDAEPTGLNFDDGLLFGRATGGGFVELRNRGNAPAPVRFTLYGPLTEPVITVGSTGVYHTMRYNDQLNEGEFVVIDPQDPSVLLGGTANRRELLNPADFRGFEIPGSSAGITGRLDVGLSHSGPATDTGSLVATFRPAWF